MRPHEPGRRAEPRLHLMKGQKRSPIPRNVGFPEMNSCTLPFEECAPNYPFRSSRNVLKLTSRVNEMALPNTFLNKKNLLFIFWLDVSVCIVSKTLEATKGLALRGSGQDSLFLGRIKK